jgi:hypothetical protein
MTIIRRGKRRTDTARNFPCIECLTPSTARTRSTRCTPCAVAYRAEWKRLHNEGYKAKLRPHGDEDETAPYPVAVRRIEKLTGVPRSEWEWKFNHPYARLATQAAKVLAGMESAA